jgi:hypothetical protein
MAEHTVESAINALRKKRVKFGEAKDEITGAAYSYLDLSSAEHLGIKSLGKVDFLSKYFGYRVIR